MTLNEAIEKYGPGQDGICVRLTEDGFTYLDGVAHSRGGPEGWREIDGRVCFVDYWGSVWTLPVEGEKSVKQVREERRAAGFTSAAQVVDAARRHSDLI